MKYRAIFHQFYLVSANNDYEIDIYLKAVEQKNNNIIIKNLIKIPDDFFFYIYETFAWIPVTLPIGEALGIDTAGCCLIKENAKLKLQELLKGWLAVFRQAPEKFQLISFRQKFEFERECVLSLLTDLLHLVNLVDDLNKTYLLYLGL